MAFPQTSMLNNAFNEGCGSIIMDINSCYETLPVQKLIAWCSTYKSPAAMQGLGCNAHSDLGSIFRGGKGAESISIYSKWPSGYGAGSPPTWSMEGQVTIIPIG